MFAARLFAIIIAVLLAANGTIAATVRASSHPHLKGQSCTLPVGARLVAVQPTVAPGEKAVVSGDHFAPMSSISVQVSGREYNAPNYRVRTDAHGAFLLGVATGNTVGDKYLFSVTCGTRYVSAWVAVGASNRCSIFPAAMIKAKLSISVDAPRFKRISDNFFSCIYPRHDRPIGDQVVISVRSHFSKAEFASLRRVTDNDLASTHGTPTKTIADLGDAAYWSVQGGLIEMDVLRGSTAISIAGRFSFERGVDLARSVIEAAP